MAYQRKTIDTWQIHVLHGGVWEYETCETSFSKAREQAKAYRQEGFIAKVKYKREQIKQ